MSYQVANSGNTRLSPQSTGTLKTRTRTFPLASHQFGQLLPRSKPVVVTEKVKGLGWGSLIGRVHAKVTVTAPGARPGHQGGHRVADALAVPPRGRRLDRPDRRRWGDRASATDAGLASSPPPRSRNGSRSDPSHPIRRGSDRAAPDQRRPGGGNLLRRRKLVDPPGHDLDQSLPRRSVSLATVVRAGSVSADSTWSPAPMTASSSGTASPACRAPARTTPATWSLIAQMAV